MSTPKFHEKLHENEARVSIEIQFHFGEGGWGRRCGSRWRGRWMTFGVWGNCGVWLWRNYRFWHVILNYNSLAFIKLCKLFNKSKSVLFKQVNTFATILVSLENRDYIIHTHEVWTPCDEMAVEPTSGKLLKMRFCWRQSDSNIPYCTLSLSFSIFFSSLRDWALKNNYLSFSSLYVILLLRRNVDVSMQFVFLLKGFFCSFILLQVQMPKTMLKVNNFSQYFKIYQYFLTWPNVICSTAW